MKKTLAFVLTAVILFITWRLWIYSGKEFLTGNEIALLDRFDQAYILRSHFPIPAESFSNVVIRTTWTKLATFQRASLWSTRTGFFIATESSHRRLRCSGSVLQLDNNLFQSEIAPGRWNSGGNEIMITTQIDGDPNGERCTLDYETYQNRNAGEIHEDLKREVNYGSGARIFPLKNPMKTGTLKRNGQNVPESEWKYLKPPSQLIFQASVLGVFNLLSTSDVLRKELYFRGGLAELRVTASGDLAGNEMPRIGVRMNGIHIGSLQLTTGEKAEYALVFPVVSGEHVLELTFENDFFDPVTKADRNVKIHRVQIDYQPAIQVQETRQRKNAKYTMDYQRSGFESQEYYANFESDGAFRQISIGTGTAEETRRSLLLAPGDEIEFPLIVPSSSLLEFGYLTQAAERAHARLQIILHRAWAPPTILFDRESETGKDWHDVRLDLARYKGENIRLRIKNSSEEQSSPILLFMSNPRIVSPNQKQQLILLFTFDALRADHLSIYGHERKTSPNIDAFARDGVVFENAFSGATWTLKSFGTTFTSLYPSFNNLRDVNETLDQSLITLPQLLHQHGYFNGGYIDNPFLHPLYGFSRGFDSYNFQITTVDHRIRSAVNWLDQWRAQKRFLFVHVISPHSPYTPPAKYVTQLSADGNTNQSFYARLLNRDHCAEVDPADLKQAALMYDGEIREIDDLFQMLINKIKEQGEYDNAMIIVMSDHGEEFLDHNSLWHGSNVFTSTSHVPLIIKFPARFGMKGIRIQRRVHLIDLVPTMLEVAGIHETTDAQGQSLLARSAPDRVLFTEGRGNILGIMNDRYHYMYAYNNSLGFDCSPQKNEQLYDLQADPSELNDLSGKRTDLIDFFRQQKQAYENGAAVFRKSKGFQKHAVEPDETMKEQMRALGYVQ